VRLGELPNLFGNGGSAQLPDIRERSELDCRKEEFSGDVVTVPLDLVLRVRAADAGLPEPEVDEFVQYRERPRGARVLVVDHDEGRDVVGEGEPSEYFNRYISVEAP
jgi:hypothetical protein